MANADELMARVYLLPNRPPGTLRAILWGPTAPRPLLVVFGRWMSTAEGVRAEYDRDEFARALALWQAEYGVRSDAPAIVAEVFGEAHVSV